MSDMAYKTVLRAVLPVSSDKEHLAWMREHVGEPVDEWDDDDEPWFTYCRRGEFEKPYLKECSWGETYGVELVLMESVETAGDLVLSVEELAGYIAYLRSLVGWATPIKLVSYSWYTGVDEPICW